MARRIRPWCHHFQRNDMPEDHRCDAKLALIGEAPGRREDEDEFGRPFIGPSGYDLEQWWRGVGLRRSDFYIDNCYPFRPPDNNLRLVPRDEYLDHANSMLWRLRRQDVNVVVPTGNYALRAILNDPRLLITDWRGSILSYTGRKCIPTIHPAATQRQKVLTKLCLADWSRIASEADSKELNLPQRRLTIDPSDAELREWKRCAEVYFCQSYRPNQPPPVLSVDVENERTGLRALTCVGLSFTPSWSITVPVLRRDSQCEAQWHSRMNWVQQILGQMGWPIVGQNFMTDLWKLVMWCPGLREPLQACYVWDLIEMAHLLDPNDGGDTKEGSADELEEEGIRVGMLDLATLTSLHTRQPYYKHLSSNPSWAVRQQYNGLDACVQREIFPVLWSKLDERNLV